MARASYDTDAIRAGAGRLGDTAHSLGEIGKLLTGLAAGACPPVIDQALEELSGRGHDMIADIGDEAVELSAEMRTAAEAYDDLDQSVVRVFRSGK